MGPSRRACCYRRSHKSKPIIKSNNINIKVCLRKCGYPLAFLARNKLVDSIIYFSFQRVDQLYFILRYIDVDLFARNTSDT